MDFTVALKLTAYVLGFGMAFVLLDALSRRVIRQSGPPPLPLPVTLLRGFVMFAVGLAAFAVTTRFNLHTWVTFGVPAAAMALVHRLFVRGDRARAVATSAATAPEPCSQPAQPEAPAAKPQPSATQTVVVIALAFAVAFAVRRYVIEAFTVPMSMMAPALHGRHFDVTCERCGGHFTETDLAVQPPARVPCPGCGGPVRIEGGIRSQDRVLAEKLSQPKRWDLAVFQQVEPDPELAGKVVTRIVGMPGERVEIGLGDVFVNGQRLVKPADRVEQLWLLVGDTAWGAGSNNPLHGWLAETDDRGPLLRYAHPITAPLLTGFDEQKLAFHFTSRPVRDVRVTADLPAGPPGPVELSWRLGDLQAAVKFDPAGSAMLLTVGADSRSLPAAVKSSVGLAVRDGVVSALADGRVIGTHPLESQSAADHIARPPPGPESCVLRVRAAASPARIRIWRDVHYFTDPAAADRVVRARLGDPFQLAANSYFVLGDNNGLSGDSRTFTEVTERHRAYCQVGALSKEMFIGVARWVYWPLQRAWGKSDRH